MKNVLKKISLMLTFLAALFMITGCPKDAPQGTKECKVTIATFDGENVKNLDFTVEEGDTLESITDLKVSLEGFDFVGYFTTNGVEFTKTQPITSDLKLYARFEKRGNPTEETNGNVTTKEETIETKTASISEAQTTITTVTTKLGDGTETTTIESVTTETKEDKTTVVTEEITEIAADGSSTKTTESTTTDANNNVVSETSVTTTTDAQGNSSTTTTDTTYDEHGTPTTHTDVQTTTASESTVEDLINFGINSLKDGNLLAAKSFFEAAYKKDSKDKQAIVASALVDLASVSANPKIGTFFKNHLGVQNYPGTLDALITGDWLIASQYTEPETFEVGVIKVEEVSKPEVGSLYICKAKKVNKNTDGAISAHVEYQIKTVEGTNYFFSQEAEAQYEKYVDKHTYFSIGIDAIMGSIMGSLSYSRPDYYKVDPDGDCYLLAHYAEDYTGPCYKYDPETEVFQGKTTYHAPTLDTLTNASDKTWFTITTQNFDYFEKLVAANILKGNVNGLDSAVDDLYEAIFDSKEYKSAVKKINDLDGDVLIPGALIDALGLTEFYGEDEEIKLGKSELKLIEALLNVYKGMFEYIQSIDLSIDLSFLKSKEIFSSFETEGTEQKALNYLMSTISSYNAAIDPLANDFLSTRNEAKLAASKATFVSVIEDIIAAYTSITGEDSIYPSVVGETLAKGSVFKDAATSLKNAISEGGVFYAPMEMSGIPATWPTKEGEGIISVDMSELFGKDLFAIGTYLQLCTVNGHKAPALYTITGENEEGDYILTNLSEIENFEFGENSFVVIKLNLSRVKKLSNMAALIPLDGDYIPLPAEVAAYVYNFYYTTKATE